MDPSRKTPARESLRNLGLGLAAAGTLAGALTLRRRDGSVSSANAQELASSDSVLVRGVKYKLENIKEFRLHDEVLPHAVHVKGKVSTCDFTPYVPLLKSYDVLLWDGDYPSPNQSLETFADAIRRSLQQNANQIGVIFRSDHYKGHNNETYKQVMYARMAAVGVHKNRIIIVWLGDASKANLQLQSSPPPGDDIYTLPNIKVGLIALQQSGVRYVICMNGGDTAYWEAINMPESVIWNIYHEEKRRNLSPFWTMELNMNNLKWGSVRKFNQMHGNPMLCFALWKAPPAKPASSDRVLVHGVEYKLEYNVNEFKLPNSVLPHAVHVKGEVSTYDFTPYVPLFKSYDVLLWDGDYPSSNQSLKTFADAIRRSLQQNANQIGVIFRSDHYKGHNNETYKQVMYARMAAVGVHKNRIIIVWLGDASKANLQLQSSPPPGDDIYTLPNIKVGLIALQQSGVRYVICMNGGDTAYWEAINMQESVIWDIYHEESKTYLSPFWTMELNMNNLQRSASRAGPSSTGMSVACFSLWKNAIKDRVGTEIVTRFVTVE